MDNQQPSINNELFYQKPKEGKGYIYKYTSPSCKNYIGQTVNSLKERAKNLYTGIGYKKCSVFYKAIQKYGFQNFMVEILEECPIELLNRKERFYIQKYNTIVPNGYNLSIGGEGGKTKEVFVYSAQNGEFLEHYNSLTLASIETGVPIETISAIMKQGSRKQTHNFVFLDKYIPKYDVSLLNENKKHSIYVYDKDGYFLSKFETVAEASRVLKIGDSSIRKCLNGNATHVFDFQFRDTKKDKIDSIPKNSKTSIEVIQIDPLSNEIINKFSSLIAAARAVGLKNSTGIKKVITRGKGTSGGYFWKIDEGSTTKCK